MINHSIENVPLPKQKIQAISLDFGNTLYDYYSVVYKMINRYWLRYQDHEVEYNNFLISYDIAFNRIDEYLTQKGLKVDQSSSNYWTEFYILLYDALGATPEICLKQSKELTKEWHTHPVPKLFPDVIPFLTLCKNNGINLALLSNTTNNFPREKLTSDKIIQYFDVVSLSYEVDSWKPDSHIFDITYQDLGVDKHSVIHVGDEFSQDMVGASRAKVHGIWRVLSIHKFSNPNFRQITSLLELESLIIENSINGD